MVFYLKKRFIYLIIIVLLGVCPFAFTQDFEKAQIETVKVTEGMYMLVGLGGNIGVSSGANGILLIDSQFAQLMEKIKAAIANIGGGPIRILFNTNWHYDHVYGNELLGKAGAMIIAHENSRKRMASEQYYPDFDFRTPPFPEAALPVLTFTDTLTLHFNGDDIQVTHIPNAHSDADLFFHFRKANVIHTGDLYFSGGYPFIDTSHGGSVDGMIKAADRILNMIDAKTKVIPGHGPLSNREEVEVYRNMLVTVRDRIAKLIKEGKTIEEVLKTKPTEDLDKGREQTAVPPEMFVKIVYNDLSKH